MIKNLNFIFLIFVLLKIVVFSQSSETLSIIVSDQNGDLITVGIVSLIDVNKKKVAEIELGKKKPVFNLNVGNYTLEIQSPGFKILNKQIEIKKGQNSIEVQLELEDIEVNIEVEESEREKRLDEVIGTFLTQKEIDSLPETGEEIREELKKRYGDDIQIRVDGDFEGSHISSKSEISSIKVIRNSFDAEFHEIGRTIIDIRTNSNISNFAGFASFNFNNSSLNARNPFALECQKARVNNYMVVFSGPIIKKKTSFGLSSLGTENITTQNFIGTRISENVELLRTGIRIVFTTFGIKHNLPKNHLLNFKYQNNQIVFKNLGLGSFDLPERGADRNNTQHRFTLVESGTFKNKYANDFTFEFSRGIEKTEPKSLETTVLVLNAFNRGGLGINNRTDRTRFRVADNLMFDTKKHSLKMGGEILYERLKNVSENNINGTFIFLNLTDFNNGKPSQFSQTLGQTEYQLSQLQTAFYIQDYFKPSKVLQISLGLRYEWQSRLKDYNNFSPRLGYVWSPEKSGKFIVRGGSGIFYDWFDNGTISSILSNDGRQGQRIIIRNPNFPNPFSDGTIPESLPQNISRLADNLVSPTVFIVQNGFNYKLDKSLTFEGIHTFKRGWHHFRSRNINAPTNGIRPNPNIGIIQLLESSGTTQENSFDLKINGYYKGVNIFANYLLSDITNDFASALSLPMDNYNLHLERGISSFNQTHKINIGFNFDYKSLNFAPSYRIESGLPYTITTGRDDNGDTVFNDRPFGIGRNTETGEWLKQVDLRIRWKIPKKYLGMKETNRRGFNFNLNIRNLLNTSNLTNYMGIQTSPFFMQATLARNPRSIEIGTSFNF